MFNFTPVFSLWSAGKNEDVHYTFSSIRKKLLWTVTLGNLLYIVLLYMYFSYHQRKRFMLFFLTLSSSGLQCNIHLILAISTWTTLYCVCHSYFLLCISTTANALSKICCKLHPCRCRIIYTCKVAKTHSESTTDTKQFTLHRSLC